MMELAQMTLHLTVQANHPLHAYTAQLNGVTQRSIFSDVNIALNSL